MDRTNNTRLAWLVLSACALVSLTLLVVVALSLRGPLTRWAQASMQAVASGSSDDGSSGDGARPSLAPLPVEGMSTVPAVPIGDPARWAGPDDYPAEALRAGEEGRVRVRLAINAAGVPSGCAVAESSGSWSLDNGTCGMMMRHGRFDAAPAGQVATRLWLSPGIRWRLPR